MKAIFVRKATNLEVVKEVTKELKEKGYKGAKYQVTREVELSNEDFRKQTSDLLQDLSFIKKDEGGINDEGEVLCIRVINKESGERILIDPQGYEYSRYTAIEEKNMKPKCKLVGADGNIFNLLGVARKALNKADQSIQANEMTVRVYEAESYDKALQIIMEYVEVE